MVTDRRVGVAGGVEDLRPRPHRRQALAISGPLIPGMTTSGDEQVERARVPPEELERRRSVAGLHHRVPAALEDLGDELPHDGLVLDEEDRLRRRRAARRADGCAASAGSSARGRKIRNVEPCRARCRPRSCPRSARRSRRRWRGRGPVPAFLRGEERVEELLALGRSCRTPVSRHRELDVLAVAGRTRSRSRSSACRRRGIASRALTTRLTITCSICAGSAWTRPSVGSSTRHELDVLADQAAQHHVRCPTTTRSGRATRGWSTWLAAEREQLAGQRRGARRPPCGSRPASRRRRASPRPLEQELAVARDRGRAGC